MNAVLKAAMASTLALATAGPALAQYQQPYQPPPQAYQPTPQYQQDLQRYQQQRGAYDQQQANYQAARDEYQRRLDGYNRARADYDARYGAGAYARLYGPAPVWSDANWAYYAPGAPPGAVAVAPAPAYGAPPPAGYAAAPPAPYYGSNTAYVAPAPQLKCGNTGAITGGLVGALAGGVLGSNVAGHGNKTEGTVLGGALGAGLGALVGHAHDSHECDARGAYYSYSNTIPYSEGPNPSPQYQQYEQQGCRLASAPVDQNGQEFRYVRVCPDSEGRYRVSG